ncbi:MAG: hypothetical protein JWM03_1646 [Rhodocyclales bacterium]|nr:hypothetical protein [Rhodocyclales bacterium]MDB5888774.1 hypothetical protein [Rhodocyclales bacterium]
MPELASLYRYVVKSCRGERLSEAYVTCMGLPLDRYWMVADEHGEMLTGRDEPRLVCIEVDADEDGDGLCLRGPGMMDLHLSRHALCVPRPAKVWEDEFMACGGYSPANAWLSQFLGSEVQLLHIGEQSTRQSQKRPDMQLSFADAFPLLLVNSASLDELSARVGRDMNVERFRPNLVVSGAAPFVEDTWRRLRIGDVTFAVEKPCERCAFTTADPVTGERSSDQEPLRTLAKFRKHNGGVLFGMNLRAENAGELRVGMPVELLD